MAASTSKVNRASCNSGSVVWYYFHLEESKGIVSCREYKQQLCNNRNTSAMREHVKRKHVHIDMTKKESNGSADHIGLDAVVFLNANGDLLRE